MDGRRRQNKAKLQSINRDTRHVYVDLLLQLSVRQNKLHALALCLFLESLSVVEIGWDRRESNQYAEFSLSLACVTLSMTLVADDD